MNSSNSASEHDPAATSTAPGAADKDTISGHHDPIVHEIEHHAKRHVDGVPRCLSFSIEKKDLRYKVEAIARDCLAFVIATSLAIFSLGVMVPPSMAVLLPLSVALVGLMTPSLLFAVFGMHPGIFGFYFLLLVFTTVFLCAVTVSNGLFVAVFALTTFLSMGSFFNYFRRGVSPLSTAVPPITMSVASMLTLSFRHLLQNGPSIDFEPGHVSYQSPTGFTLGSASLTPLIDILQTSSEQDISFVCPEETGIFSGQTCTLSNSTTNPGMLTASANGGLYLVAALWTERGINNPLAFASNWMIGVCWITACLVAVILFIPPIRKFRNMLTKFIIPETLEGLATMLESFNNNSANLDEIDVADPFTKGREKLQMMAKKIAPKKNAGMLAFEPRFRHDPTIDYIPHMEAMLNSIQSLILILHNYHGHHKARGVEVPDQSETVKILRTVASAVKESDESILDGLDVPSINLHVKVEDGLPLPHDISLSNVVLSMASKIYSSSRTWLHVHNNNDVEEDEKHRADAIRRTIRAWFTSAMCSCDLLTTNWIFVGVRLIFRKQGASLEKIGTRRLIMTLIWSAKWTAGAVALVCLQLYSKGYDALSNKRDMSTDFESTAVIMDWELIAYFFSFQFTMEGTVKKGLMRLVGTLLGGFSAWVGIMLCSWSYNGTNPINPYAWIAWLAVNQFIWNFHGKGAGVSAFLGMEYDTSFFAFYYNLTLILVGMESFLGEYSINEGVARRVSNNMLGIAIAMFVSILPPYYSATDPTFTIDYCEEIMEFHRSVANQYVENQAISMESVMQMEDNVVHFRKKAELILTDGGRFHALPYCQPPPGLKSILDILIAEEAYLVWIYKHLAETNHFQSQNHDLLKPAMEEVLEGKDKTAPAIARFLREADERDSRLFFSYLNRVERLKVLRDKLESYQQPRWMMLMKH